MARQPKAHPEPRFPGAHDIARSPSMLALHRRDVILEAIARSAEELLRADELDSAILPVLKRIGIASHATALEWLRQAGVRLAIDDFGTGFSSLGYLRAFRVSRLKITQNFVNGVPENADDDAIVRAIIFLANALGIETVAEGVAGAAQRAFLAEAGCQTAQGNVLGAAMPAEDMSVFLRRSAQPL